MTIKTHGRMFTDKSVSMAQINVTDGTDGQALVTDGSGALRFATVGVGGSVGSSTYVEDTFTGNNVLTKFQMTATAAVEESILVFVDGVAQPTTTFTLSSSGSGIGVNGALDEINITPAIATGQQLRVCHLGINTAIADNSITGSKIAMTGDQAGDIMYYSSPDYARLGIGTAGQHLATNSGATAPEWVTSTAGGVLVQRKVTKYATAGSGTESIAFDSTRPGGTEGNEIFGVAFTPTNNNNNLLITARIYCDHSGDNTEHAIIITREVTGSNAPGASLSLSSGSQHETGTGQYVDLTFIDVGSIGTTSQTWVMRGGCAAGQTFYWNRHADDAAAFANIMSSWMIIDEYTP